MAAHRLTRLTLAAPAPASAPGTEDEDASPAQAPASDVSAAPADPPELYDSVRNSRTVEDFTRFVSELRLNRQASRSTLPGTPLHSSHQQSASQNGASTAATSAAAAAAAAPGDDSSSTMSDDNHHHHHHHPHTHLPAHMHASSSSSSRNFDDDNVSILDDVSIRYGVHPAQGSTRAPISVRCTCCCNKSDCERANRAMNEWAALEEDLRLAAEIGQSLLHKHDAAVAALSKAQDEHVQQRDSLMSRLTQSIRESAGLQRQLAQTTLNLEAADASNRTLLSELDEARSATKTLKRSQARLSIVEKHIEKLARELNDARAETTSERKRAEVAEAKAKKLAGKVQSLTDKLEFAQREAELMAEKAASPQLGEDALREARERLQLSLQASASSDSANGSASRPNGRANLASAASGEDQEEDAVLVELRAELEVLTAENARLKEEGRQASAALDAARDEAAQLRESLQEQALSNSPGMLSARRLHPGGASGAATAQQLRKPSGASISTAFSDTYSLPVSKGSTADRSSDIGLDGEEAEEEDGADQDGAGAEGEGDETRYATPVALSDEVVMRDLAASLPSTSAARPKAPHSLSTFSEADSASATTASRDSLLTNRGGGGGGGAPSMVMSPTSASAASTAETSAAQLDDVTGGVAGLGVGVGVTSSPAKPPSIRSQSSAQHRRSGSVASSLRGGAAGPGGETGFPGGRSSASLAPSASSYSSLAPDAAFSPTLAAGVGAGTNGGGLTSTNTAAGDGPRDTRTAQLSNLLDYVARIYNRLISTDIDTLHRRLQRQHLAGGDVGHLARTTVNSIVRDVEALRAHFRKLTEAEQRAALSQQASASPQPGSGLGSGSTAESLVVRRDFFALLKILQNLFAETARLRACVNEIHLQPSAASKILHEHLGLSVLGAGAGGEGAGGGGGAGGLISGGWLARMFTAVPGAGGSASGGSGAVLPPAAPVTPGISGAPSVPTPFVPSAGQPAGAGAGAPPLTTSRTNSSISVLGTPTGEGPVPLPSVSGTSPRPVLPRTAAVPVAVEVKAGARGTATATPAVDPSIATDELAAVGVAVPRPQPVPGRSTLTRTQSRNLSGLFVGSQSGSGSVSAGLAQATAVAAPGTSLVAAADESWDIVSQADAVMSGLASSSSSAAINRQSMLFRSGAGGAGAGSRRPLSRIVDDDELSIHQGRRGYGGGAGTGPSSVSKSGVQLAEDSGEQSDFQRFTSAAARAADGAGGGGGGGGGGAGGRGLHRRGLSDSSMHSTFLEQGGGQDGGATGGGGRTGAGGAGAGGGPNSAAGLLATRSGVGGPGGALASLRTSPMARIITPATLSLQVSSNASGRTSAQFARSMSGSGKAGAPSVISAATATATATSAAGPNWSLAPSSPSISEDSGASFSTGGVPSREKRAASSAASSGPRGLMPSLRAAPSAVALLFPGAGTARTASASSSLSATNAEAAGLSKSSTASTSTSGASPGKGSGGLPR
ncbi:hypothetical protein OC844_002917 [Tilletia horrida]|nr:hypothetical protein OC844_002917 [Tilletia horrida]